MKSELATLKKRIAELEAQEKKTFTDALWPCSEGTLSDNLPECARKILCDVRGRLELAEAKAEKMREVVEAAREAPDWLLLEGCGVEEKAVGKRILDALAALDAEEKT